MYSRPPFVQTGGIALIAGVATANVLLGPGANLRYRVSAVYLGISRTAGAAVVDATVLDAVSGNVYLRAPGAMQLTGTSGFYIPVPEPGIPFDVASDINVTFASTVAAGSGIVLVYYYIDRMT